MITIISNKVKNIVEYVMDNKTIENRQNDKAVGSQNPFQDQEIVIDEISSKRQYPDQSFSRNCATY